MVYPKKHVSALAGTLSKDQTVERKNFWSASEHTCAIELQQMTRLDTMVTVVDASSILDIFASGDTLGRGLLGLN